MKLSNGVMWNPTGPRLEMQNRGKDCEAEYRYCLHIDDQNPAASMTWCFSRWTMIRIGLWFIARAVFERGQVGAQSAKGGAA